MFSSQRIQCTHLASHSDSVCIPCSRPTDATRSCDHHAAPDGSEHRETETAPGSRRSTRSLPDHDPTARAERRSDSAARQSQTRRHCQLIPQPLTMADDRNKLNKAITLANAGDYEGAAKEMSAVSPDSVRPRHAPMPRRATLRHAAPHHDIPHRAVPTVQSKTILLTPTHRPTDPPTSASAPVASGHNPSDEPSWRDPVAWRAEPRGGTATSFASASRPPV